MTTIKSFVGRLAKIGIKVTLIGNYPWVYLDTVNDKKVWGKFRGNHGFTVFFINKGEKITDIPVIFAKIKEMLCERVREYEVYYPYYEWDANEEPEDRILFYGTEDQCIRWRRDYDDREEYFIRKVK